MKCSICGKEFSPKVCFIHEQTCKLKKEVKKEVKEETKVEVEKTTKKTTKKK